MWQEEEDKRRGKGRTILAHKCLNSMMLGVRIARS